MKKNTKKKGKKKKVLLYRTGNYIQYPVINQNGRGYKKEYIQICAHGAYINIYVAVQSLNCVQIFDCSMPGFPVL